MNKIREIVNEFESTSLKEMDNVKLMNRTDTKFIFNVDKLPCILEQAKEKYKVLQINDERILDYKTQYFDTKNFDLYIKHQNKKLNRYKFRQREYLISDISFFEVKFKSNKGRTIKKRIKTKGLQRKLTTEFVDFIRDNTPFSGTEFDTSVLNKFSRITLVHKKDSERITIDINLEYELNGNRAELPFLCIAEVKREGYNVSDFISILKENRVYTQSMSKYSIGVLLLNKDLKYNNFKEKLLTLKKIARNDKYDSLFNRN